ncbi:PQQ-dependent dehydrogenase, methanol/ethanol family [Sphingomonas naphthae]|uniref:PQQ-dependent dehydrogenase, methanol/ethanol family n=2 Tax=Sphingomonas naphthae TaxID=1813468 RepID=A0ABY7TQG0_9SPHN|nr:PQQ-dependent dehydrogenase, methanol/ethanol family [Sphingomonas naphthae]WCT75373.1 PQQ-dependent dehydrogenase, methanol/ethanol family [Sphingomonas naphthae]
MALAGISAAALGLSACSSSGSGGGGGDAQPSVTLEDWKTIGGSSKEQFYSSLSGINDSNVKSLGLAWYADFDTSRGQEANVVVVDGVLYTSTAWSKVYAYDAKTGKQLWMFDPEVAGRKGYDACCDVVNRGVAVSGGKLYVGALDGRLIALDAKSGAKLWEVQTTDTSKPYTITGAPRVVKGKVLIGNGGAEYGVRGYVTAYDAATGKQVWRFYTVPGDPAKGKDNAASDPQMETAAKSWFGKWYQYGGGGTVWDAIVYDEELNQVLIGVGNGSPWNQRVRSDGKGDNLFLSSVVALDPDTGKYKWHFQETPGETWDFTATQPIILADLKIDGAVRKVMMQAPKNGFFYVIDRQSGKFISAKNFVPVNWATGADPKTGRPIEVPEARWGSKDANFVARPGAYGAHSWQPMAYSPKTGLVYIPAQDVAFGYQNDANFKYAPGMWNLANVSPTNLAQDSSADMDKLRQTTRGEIVAWDPVKQKAAWRVQHNFAGNGGILATGGNLLFQGSPDGSFNAYSAADGKKLWSSDVQTGVVAAPSTFKVGNDQYVAVAAGFGGVFALFSGLAPNPHQRPNGRLLVFKLNGTAKLPAYTPPATPPNPPKDVAPAARVQEGFGLYAGMCTACHGGQAWSNGVIPDLRRSVALTDPNTWQSIVYGGALEPNGMISFKGKLTPEQIESIRLYVGERARKLKIEIEQGGRK